MRHVKPHSHTCKSKNQLILSLKIKTLLFLLGEEGKTGVLRGYCGGKGPKKFIKPWALFEDMDRSKKEEQIVVKHSQLKSQGWGISERLFEEELLGQELGRIARCLSNI